MRQDLPISPHLFTTFDRSFLIVSNLSIEDIKMRLHVSFVFSDTLLGGGVVV
jgi:hypothetical protein